ncbi:hypothetical protein X801_08961 [Opisthorchis viverrini]|uniref:Uncharacterized protein n=1 Tax=Opisthorchis viverrini TaxID=6198 RepID=A0A1S8WLD2_OPIVI|nr:hypothetical protein X801_08961 [Opisthorchis viverrini]
MRRLRCNMVQHKKISRKVPMTPSLTIWKGFLTQMLQLKARICPVPKADLFQNLKFKGDHISGAASKPMPIYNCNRISTLGVKVPLPNCAISNLVYRFNSGTYFGRIRLDTERYMKTTVYRSEALNCCDTYRELSHIHPPTTDAKKRVLKISRGLFSHRENRTPR